MQEIVEEGSPIGAGNEVPAESGFETTPGNSFSSAQAVEESPGDQPQEATDETSTPTDTEKTAGQETSINWSEVPEQYSKAYKNVQSVYTRTQQENKQLLEQLNNLNGRVGKLSHLEQALAANPDKATAINSLLFGSPQSQEPEIDPTLQNDPLFGHVKNQAQEIAQLKSIVSEFTKAKQQEQVDQQIDREIANMKGTFKEMFGKDMSESQVTEGLKKMGETGIYDGEALMAKLFRNDYVNHIKQQTLQEQKAKKGISINTPSMNSSAARQNSDAAFDLRQAFDASMEELGFVS